MSGRPTKWRQILPGLQRIFRHVRPHLRAERGLIGGAVAALLLATLFRLAEPWPLKFVLDRVIVTDASAPGSGIAMIDALGPGQLLAFCAIGVVVVIGLRAFAQYLSTIGFALAGQRVLTRVREQLFAHLQRLSLHFHERQRAGDLTLRVVGDVGMLKEAAVTAFLPMLANILVVAGMAAVMLWLDWRLALLAFLPLPLLWLATSRIGKRIGEVSRQQRKREGAMAATASEALGAVRLVQSLGLEERLGATFGGASSKDLRDGVRAKRLAAGLERSVDVLVGLSIAAVLFQGARLVMAGALTPGDLVVFITYLKNTFRPIRQFAKHTSRVAKAVAAGERVVEVLEVEPEIADRPDARPAPALRGDIRFDGVSFAFTTGSSTHGPVLDRLDLEIPAGQCVALLGASGAGKSTITNLLLRLYEPTSGRVLFDGLDARTLTLRSLRRQIGVVPQESLLLRASVAENIRIADAEASDADVAAAARLADAHGFIERLPEGYATLLGERGATLSSGQRQRIAIARAALRRTPILLLDEPTTGLDGASETQVVEALLRVARGRTTLIVTHDPKLARRCDRIVYLEAGRIVEDGAPELLLHRPGSRFARLHATHRQAPFGATENAHGADAA
jgi:ATP-binding cassette subfamily B protein